jgi:hypothetical protein
MPLNRFKRRLVTLIVTGFLAAGFAFWFYVLPHRLFHPGMSYEEVHDAVGGRCSFEPAAVDFSSTSTELEKLNTTVYGLSVKSMLVGMDLNYYKRVIRVHFLVGPEEVRVYERREATNAARATTN